MCAKDNPYDRVEFVMEVAPKLAEAATESFHVAVNLAAIGDAEFDDNDMEYVCGYICGYCDILAQRLGGDGGGSLSMTTTARVFQQLFGLEYGEELFHFSDRCMRGNNPMFSKGLASGGEDGNGAVVGKLPSGLQKHFKPNLGPAGSE
jgi:hypothetical protein